MPELPEVEMKRRYVAHHALGQQIARIHIPDPTVLDNTTASKMRKSLRGTRFDDTRRHGKWLFVQADRGGWLVMHFGLTGHARYGSTNDPPKYTRFAVEFECGDALFFTDPRKFGGIGFTNDADAFLSERNWGPDPLDPGFDVESFREALRGRTGNLKGLLLNQKVIAGIGNLYADEMLFQCGLHPNARAGKLKPATVDALYAAMMGVFEASLEIETRYEALPDRFLLRHRNYDGNCPKCDRPLAVMTAGGRTTYYCTRHQRRRT